MQTLDLLARNRELEGELEELQRFTAGRREERMAVCSLRLLRNVIWADNSRLMASVAVKLLQR